MFVDPAFLTKLEMLTARAQPTRIRLPLAPIHWGVYASKPGQSPALVVLQGLTLVFERRAAAQAHADRLELAFREHDFSVRQFHAGETAVVLLDTPLERIVIQGTIPPP